MSFAEDDEILQDFLVEAGEILERMSEELVELEGRPDDMDLLNSIFRGFHTVKGGAGFLQVNAMVDLCHITENVFDILRNGQRAVDAELMDVALQALDAVNIMYGDLSEGQEPDPASPDLIASLEALVSGTSAASEESAEPVAEPEPEPVQENNDISDDEFESFVESLGDIPCDEPEPTSEDEDKESESAAPAGETEFLDTSDDSGAAALTSDEISDEEFELLLDSLHGKGQHGGLPKEETNAEGADSEGKSAEETKAAVVEEKSAPAANNNTSVNANNNGDEITDDEFENLMDQLHGKGKGPTGGAELVTGAASSTESAASKPAADSGSDKTETPQPQQPAPAAKAAVAPAKSAAQSTAAKEDKSRSDANKAVSAPAETTVRVDTQRLDEIMNMVGELVLVRNRLVRLGSQSGDESMSKAVANLDVVTADLQTSVMKTRMQPIKKVFGRFPRVVRDLARNLKKEVSLELVGEETDLDKNLVEALADPLVHLVRNSVDHGIEMPEVREKSGKARQGKVILAAEQEGDHILLTITDDGAGMDPDVLREKAVSKGLYDQDAADRLSDRECFELIFMPGFSTKTEISDVSGRGVGMDVVKTKIAQLNGSIEIDSKIGQGSKIAIKVPLTLAIMPTLMVMLEEQIFAFPLVSVNEIFNLDLNSTSIVDGQEVIVVREKTIPLFHLKHWLTDRKGNDVAENAHVVVITVGTQKVGFVVDQLIGQEEVVIKPLGKMLSGTPGMAGATITGDGTIALILDVPTLLNRYASKAMSCVAA